MAIDTTSPRSRRALLAAALGAGAATVASALGRPLPARAADGNPVLLGQVNTATYHTIVSTTFGDGLRGVTSDSYSGVYGLATHATDPSTGVQGEAEGTSGVGVRGHSWSTSGSTFGVYGMAKSTGGTAVWGDSTAVTGAARGVLGTSLSTGGTGVQGYSGQSPIPAPSPKTGVFGFAAQDATAVGVKGESTSGTGVLATATTGTALRVAGKAKFSRSGKASVPANKTYVDVTPSGGLASNSVVHATLQTYRSGVGIAAVRTNWPTTGKARIYLTKVASTTASTSVAWLVTEY